MTGVTCVGSASMTVGTPSSSVTLGEDSGTVNWFYSDCDITISLNGLTASSNRFITTSSGVSCSGTCDDITG